MEKGLSSPRKKRAKVFGALGELGELGEKGRSGAGQDVLTALPPIFWAPLSYLQDSNFGVGTRFLIHMFTACPLATPHH